MIPIRPWQLLLLLLLALGAALPLGARAIDLVWNGRTDLTIGSRLAPDRPLAPDPPRQTGLTDAAPVPHDGYLLHPVAAFELEALVLSRNVQRWPFADAGKDLAPLDLALGWGLMSTPREIEKLTIWQWGRFYFWKVRDGAAFDAAAAIPASTNVHLIPASPEIRRALMRAREGDLIRLEGRLVDVSHPDLGWWRSSRNRTDTGDGACEILLVERVLLRPYRLS
jgi:hypothetical protein